jgi:hypothetical protein
MTDFLHFIQHQKQREKFLHFKKLSKKLQTYQYVIHMFIFGRFKMDYTRNADNCFTHLIYE